MISSHRVVFLLLLASTSLGYADDTPKREYAIAIAPATEENILLWRRTRGFARSTDGGDTFVPIGSNLEDVTSLAILDGGNVLAAAGGQLFSSSDGGRTWSDPNVSVRSKRLMNIVRLPESGVVIATTTSGIARSTDQGATWTMSVLEGQNTEKLGGGAFSRKTHELFVPIGSTILRSADLGETWSRLSMKDDLPIYSIAIAEAGGKNPQKLFVTTPKGVYSSSDGGAKWKEVNDDVHNFGNLWISEDGGTFLVLAYPIREQYANYWRAGVDERPRGVFRSTDNGKHWGKDLSPEPGDEPWTLWRISKSGKYVFVQAGRGALYRSTNMGETWKSLSSAVEAAAMPMPTPTPTPTPVPTPTREVVERKGRQRIATFKCSIMGNDVPLAACLEHSTIKVMTESGSKVYGLLDVASMPQLEVDLPAHFRIVGINSSTEPLTMTLEVRNGHGHVLHREQAGPGGAIQYSK